MTEPEPPTQVSPIEIRPTDQDFFEINPLGARLKLTLTNNPILVSITRGDGKTGETHPCTPIFGPDKNNLFSLKQHGEMRNTLCNAEKVGDTVIVTHDVKDSPGKYPSGMQVKQEISLKDGIFSLVMTHTNTGEKPASVNSGEHCYFNSPQGYKGTRVNGIDVSEYIEKDRTIPLNDVNVIGIPGMPDLVLTQQGFKYAMLWVGKNSDGEPDKNYVCIEPVEGDPLGDYFGSPESIIAPGETRSAQFSIALKS